MINWTKNQRIQPAADDMILFLCPSGHKLHGLKRLAGKVGKCPHCDAKFEIPFPYDTDDEDAGRDELDDTVTEDPLSDFAESEPAGAASNQQPVFEEPPPERPRESDTTIEARVIWSRPRDWQQHCRAASPGDRASARLKAIRRRSPIRPRPRIRRLHRRHRRNAQLTRWRSYSRDSGASETTAE